ncbi:tyrosine-type recombinase/integrase [Edwardsiella anguillarum]|uniref:tyrosine-type recombinase/integrase n=1 Tax=Edwardsiella anguillarum TaxID=1821960 RepID=UPI0024B804C0|nr:tyrosine-type recombinase/integrase [Edwardsiella anguillarum]WHQ13410.1 integrase family protein [Edwardsiella anguillarum]
MPQIATQGHKNASGDEFLNAAERWESCKPPYTSTHMKVCVAAAKVILNHQGQMRRSKYEKDSYLRIEFSRSGKTVIYAEFPKRMGLKGRKLGEWPEMSLEQARAKARLVAAGGLRAESVHQVLKAYKDDLEAKVLRKKLGEHSFSTYCCRINQLEKVFGPRDVFSDVTYSQLIEALDQWVITKSNNQAIELFAELRRFWKFAAPLFSHGQNLAASIPDDYVSSRVQRPTPTRLFTDIESIATLWLNVAGCTSLHQKNAMRFMILTGIRPININNLRWDYVSHDMQDIVYPAGLIGMRGAMKTQKEFRMPVTQMMKNILEEQKAWRDSVEDCNRDYVFLQPRDPRQPFSKRSLDKLMKTYFPKDAVKGIRHDGTVKGKKDAFNTLCRKFFKSNVIAQMRSKGYSRTDTREISLLCLHHSNKGDDPMAEYYDFSDEILQEEMALKRLAFQAHEDSILAQVALIRRRNS